MVRPRRNKDRLVIGLTATILLFAILYGISAQLTDSSRYKSADQIQHENADIDQTYVEREIISNLQKRKSQEFELGTIITIDEANRYYYEMCAKYPSLLMEYSPKIAFLRYSRESDDIAGYKVSYISKESGKLRAEELCAVADDIIQIASKQGDDEEKVSYVLRWLAENCRYTKTPDNMWDTSMYGCLVDGRSTCVGYAESFQYLMNELGIKSEIVVDVRNKKHAWNAVSIDGKRIEVDPTNAR